jgi:spore coat polysaccharide biosynthesis predicted glycosyltransferase SpsG
MIFWLKPNFGPMVGYGHLSRLIAITEELVFRNHVYCFHFSNSQDVVANKMMSASGLSFGCKCHDFSDLLIIDSYTEHSSQQESWPNQGPKILQIVDDINPKLYADAYIEASPISNWTPANNNAAILEFDASPILRKRFDSKESPIRPKSNQNNKILISLGASNSIEQIIISIKIAIEKSKYQNHQVFCLLSGNDLNSLRTFLSENRIIPIEPGVLVVDIAFDFDLVISACGVTAWEILSSKAPCILIGGAENQRNQLDYFVNLNIADGLMFENQDQFVSPFAEKLNGFSSQQFAREICNGRIRAVDWIESFQSI